jgi:hypothetical protein
MLVAIYGTALAFGMLVYESYRYNNVARITVSRLEDLDEAIVAMTRSKYLLILIVLASFIASRFAREFVSQPSPSLEAAFIVAASYLLAVVFLATSERWNGKSACRLGTKVLLCGLPMLAAAIAIGATVVSLKVRDFCNIIDCLSLHGFARYHLPYFLCDFAVITWQLYEIMFLSFLFVRLIWAIQKIL